MAPFKYTYLALFSPAACAKAHLNTKSKCLAILIAFHSHEIIHP